MSFGSFTEGGAAEDVGGALGTTPSYSSGYDYSLGAGTTPGLTASYDRSPGYGFNSGTNAGFSPGDYALGGGLGTGLNAGLGAGYAYAPTDYGLASLGLLSNAAYGGDGAGVGLQATATPGGAAGLGTNPNTNAFSQRDEPGFWGSKAQKVMSFFANMHPVTALLNAGASALNSQDPVKAAIQGLLGRFGGAPGQLANVGYNIATSPNPVASGLGVGGSLAGGMLGGAIAGQPGAQLGSSLLGGALASAATPNAAYGAYGTGSAVADALGRMATGTSPGGARPSTGYESPGRNWTDTAMALASGIYGMNQANAQRALARQAAAPSAAAGAALQKVISGDFTGDAGFDAAQKAAARAGAQQPGGFAASAAAQAALKYQNDRIAALSGASGSGQGYANALGGINSANALASSSLGSLGFGASSGSSMPPWLQQYLVRNGMGGTANA